MVAQLVKSRIDLRLFEIYIPNLSISIASNTAPIIFLSNLDWYQMVYISDVFEANGGILSLKPTIFNEMYSRKLTVTLQIYF